MGTSVRMAGGSLADDGGSHEAARVGQSSSAHRLIAAPHEHAIHAVAVDRRVELAAALVLLGESVEGGAHETLARTARPVPTGGRIARKA